MKRIPFINGDEQDVLGSAGRTARKFYTGYGRAGATSRIKRAYRRRERRHGKNEIAAYTH